MKLKISKKSLLQSVQGRFRDRIQQRRKKIAFLRTRMSMQTDQQKRQILQAIQRLQKQIANLQNVLRTKVK